MKIKWQRSSIFTKSILQMIIKLRNARYPNFSSQRSSKILTTLHCPPRQRFLESTAFDSHGRKAWWAGPPARALTRGDTSSSRSGGACGPPPRHSAGSSSCSAPSSLPRLPPPPSPAFPHPAPRAPASSGSGPTTRWRRPPGRCTRRTRRPSCAGSRRHSTAPGTRARQVGTAARPSWSAHALCFVSECVSCGRAADARSVFDGIPWCSVERSGMLGSVDRLLVVVSGTVVHCSPML